MGLGWVFPVHAVEYPPKEPREPAIFSGGSFWYMEQVFTNVKGVVAVVPGYTGGKKENPNYESVAAGGTGHLHAVRVVYDPRKISYAELLDLFWHNIDPTTKDQQSCDKGNQYRSAIFYHTSEQQQMAEETKDAWIESGKFKKIYTEILPAARFYVAENDQQDYYIKNPIRYKLYQFSCGRERRLQEIWGKNK
jgi:peptide-methionine (S)-S-oxide reductase